MKRNDFIRDFDKLGLSKGESLRDGCADGMIYKYNAEFLTENPVVDVQKIEYTDETGTAKDFTLATVDMKLQDVDTNELFVKAVDATGAEIRTILAMPKCEGIYGVVGIGKLNKLGTRTREDKTLRITKFTDLPIEER